jgi:hypothetical protein
MTWRDMGTIAPVTDWQMFPFSTTGEVFRLIQTWNTASYWRAIALVAQFFSGDRLTPRRIWAVNGTTLEFLKIPQPLKDAGIVDRQIGILLLTPYRPMDVSLIWSIELQVFDGGLVNAQPDQSDSYRADFGSAALLDGRLIVNHGLGATPTSVQVTDSLGDVVMPDNITVLNDDTLEVDLRSFGDVDDWDIRVEV